MGNTKQTKLANAANKKAQSQDAVNQSLRNEINQLAASISTLRLTMTMGSAMGTAQNTFTFAPSTTQILHQTAPNATEPGHGNNLLRGRQSQSVALPLTTTGPTTQGHQGMEHQSEHGTADRDSMDDGDQESDLDLHSEGPPELPRAASMLTAKQMKKLKKKRKSMIRASASSRQVLETPPAEGRKRSGSGGSIKSARS